jgi:hypothetical protein
MKLETLTTSNLVAHLSLLAGSALAGLLASAVAASRSHLSHGSEGEYCDRPATTSDLGEWVGVYPLSEFSEPHIFFEYRIVILEPGNEEMP